MYEGTGVIRRTHGVLPGMHRKVEEDPYTYVHELEKFASLKDQIKLTMIV